MTWLSSLKKTIALNNGCVLITVIATKGSTPCSVGDKIVYSNKQLAFGSIGGGNLEFQALTLAQNLLDKDSNSTHLEKYPLGATLGQCCGGYVKVMFESFVNNSTKHNKKNSWLESASDLIEKQQDFVIATIIKDQTNKENSGEKFVYTANQDSSLYSDSDLNGKIRDGAYNLLSENNSPTIVQYQSNSESLVEVCYEKVNNTELQSVAIFGAGHISRALMPILSKLPIRIYWIDDRAEQFEQYQGDTSQINIVCDDFISGLEDLPDETYCLVITYSHQMDFDICEKIISRNSFSYLGMIGSRIKGNKFRDRLLQKGHPKETVDKFICPIGAKQKFLKSPTAIAVTIAMDLLNFLENKKQTMTV
jgi:xanthine dehydrogenase accessory factor